MHAEETDCTYAECTLVIACCFVLQDIVWCVTTLCVFHWLQGVQGLGIMIIEGKHAEVGQGIFISDIQEGSAAEQVSYLSHGFIAWLVYLLNMSCYVTDQTGEFVIHCARKVTVHFQKVLEVMSIHHSE
jgi:hypothetical protein